MPLRKAIHDLTNKIGNILLPVQLYADLLNHTIKEKPLDFETKELLENLVKDLVDMEASVKAADFMFKQIRALIYTKIDPDRSEVEFT